MRLKNKKTGKTWFLEHIAILDKPVLYTNGKPLRQYTTLAELNEEWEDYIPSEPLIKDEKIRNAVRAWAEACNIESCYLDRGEFCTKHREIDCCIGFGDTTNEMLEEKHYTIAELCGEEEE